MASKQDVSPAQWALDLLEPRPEDYKTNWSDYWLIPNGALVGAGTVVFRNHILNRPLYTNIHLSVIGLIVGGLCGAGVMYVTEVHRARKDAILRDYIRLHPDRFPEPQNRKYADILEPWEPHR
ncbi:NADH dehydrogenase [ubiquinone] 1 subunit C2 [Anthophora quadrimaculata]